MSTGTATDGDIAQSILAAVRALAQQLDALGGPEQPLMLRTVRVLRDQAEAAVARSRDEAARAARGIGAAPRFGRLR